MFTLLRPYFQPVHLLLVRNAVTLFQLVSDSDSVGTGLPWLTCRVAVLVHFEWE